MGIRKTSWIVVQTLKQILEFEFLAPLCVCALFQGVRVWVPDRDQVWVGGEVVSVQEERRSMEVRVEGEEEENRVIGAKDPLPLLRNPQMLVGANDLTTLSYLHEPAGTGHSPSSSLSSSPFLLNY